MYAASPLFLYRDMLPEAGEKSEVKTEIHSLIATRCELVKHRVFLLNKAQTLSVRCGTRIPKRTLTGRAGFGRAVESQEWSRIEQVGIDAIAAQLGSVRETCRTLEKEIEVAARALSGFDCIIGVRGIGTLSAALFLCTIGDIGRFAKPGSLANLLGMTPRVSQSSDSRKINRITPHGYRPARTRLVQFTLAATKYSSCQ